MDRRALLYNTLEGTNDRIPCAFWYHFGENNKFGQAALQAHIDFYDAFEPDIMKVMNEHPFKYKGTVTCSDDFAKLEEASFDEIGYTDYIEEFKAVRKALPKDLPLLGTIQGAMVSAYHATDTPGNFVNLNNKISKAIRENPEAACHAIEISAKAQAKLCEMLMDAGCDGFFYAALGGEKTRFDEETFEKCIKPYDDYVFNTIKDKGGIAFLHMCKPEVDIPRYQGIKADVINWAVHDCPYKLNDGRKYFPGVTVFGGYDDRSGVLVEGTKEDIINEFHKIVDEAGRKKLIIGADCTLPENIEKWRVQTVLQEARKF